MSFINNRIYIFGGFQEGGVLNDLYSIDLLTWSWIKINPQGPIPKPRQGMASMTVGKKIYIVSGCNFREQKCYSDTYILDTESLWWTKIEDK
jgi:N-acetylneuraminic acid mutarotase